MIALHDCCEIGFLISAAARQGEQYDQHQQKISADGFHIIKLLVCTLTLSQFLILEEGVEQVITQLWLITEDQMPTIRKQSTLRCGLLRW